MPRKSADERVAKRTVRNGNGCLVWTRSVGASGYPQMSVDGRVRNVHRFLYMRAHPETSEALDVLHTCDNKRCVELSHLYAGTKSDNALDLRETGRGGKQKLGWPEVELIRAMYADGHKSRELATAFNMTWGAVSNIVAGRTWFQRVSARRVRSRRSTSQWPRA